jgi:hypothetical protein
MPSVTFPCSHRSDYTEQGSSTVSLPRTAVAVHIIDEGRRKMMIMSWAISEVIYLFNVKSIICVQ